MPPPPEASDGDSTNSDSESEETFPDIWAPQEANINKIEQTRAHAIFQKALSESNVDDLEAKGKQ